MWSIKFIDSFKGSRIVELNSVNVIMSPAAVALIWADNEVYSMQVGQEVRIERAWHMFNTHLDPNRLAFSIVDSFPFPLVREGFETSSEISLCLAYFTYGVLSEFTDAKLRKRLYEEILERFKENDYLESFMQEAFLDTPLPDSVALFNEAMTEGMPQKIRKILEPSYIKWQPGKYCTSRS